jgi:ribosomal protein S18 acetylase RimI-like enzyme
MTKAMRITRAQIEDAQEILTLQKLAYQSEAAIVNDYTIPPLTQTLEEITAQFVDHVFVKGIIDSRIIGSARAYQDQGTCFIGRVIVHPDFQNQGLGSQILQAIENEFPDAKQFELFTGSKNERNLHFYQKLG